MTSLMLQLTGFTRVERHEMISRVKEAILGGGGYVTDFHMFSNAAICINFEVSPSKVASLSESLMATGLRLSRESRGVLEGYADQSGPLSGRGKGPCPKSRLTVANFSVPRLYRAGRRLFGQGRGKEAEVVGTLNITFIHDEPDLRMEVPPIPG